MALDSVFYVAVAWFRGAFRACKIAAAEGQGIASLSDFVTAESADGEFGLMYIVSLNFW